VMSPGLSEPLKFPRQYKKYGQRSRNFDEWWWKITGEITAVDEEKVTLTLSYRRPKLVGKGKEDVVEDKEIPYLRLKKH
jgi:ribosome maturation factor RimP